MESNKIEFYSINQSLSFHFQFFNAVSMSLSEKERITVLMMRGYGDRVRSCQEVANLFNDNNPERQQISKSTVHRTVSRFEQTGSVSDKPRSGRPKSASNEEKSLGVLLNFQENVHSSTRKVAQQVGVSQTSVVRILNEHKYHPYKIKLVQELSDDDFDRRTEYCEEMMHRYLQNDRFFFWTCFSDEATFQLNGAVNRHNFRYWATENPHWMRDSHTQYPQKLNVWAGILCNQIVGPFFIDGNLTAQKYVALLENQIIPAIREISGQVFDDVWFQQDGAQVHFALIVRNLLNATFPERWIGRRGAIEWPPRSPDMTPLDFFYWGYLKSKVYVTKPNDLDDLKERIRTVSNSITPEMLDNVTTGIYHRVAYCQEQGGKQFEQLLN